MTESIGQEANGGDTRKQRNFFGNSAGTILHKTWAEAKQPPVFRKAAEAEGGRSVESVFWLSPAHASEPGVWYAGTSPPGLFRSADGGVTWDEVAGFNDGLYPKIKHAIVPGPDGAQVHSVCVDPADAGLWVLPKRADVIGQISEPMLLIGLPEPVG